MKEIFLSLQPQYFKAILFGLKKYEYRKRFCNEATTTYLYLSGKSRQVVGVMELGLPIRLDKTLNAYLSHPDTYERVSSYIELGYINAIPIKSLTLFEKPLTLEDLRNEIPKFMPPQMYFVLDNHPELKKLLKSQKLSNRKIIHKHETIYYDNLAVSTNVLEQTKEYKQALEKEDTK